MQDKVKLFYTIDNFRRKFLLLKIFFESCRYYENGKQCSDIQYFNARILRLQEYEAVSSHNCNKEMNNKNDAIKIRYDKWSHVECMKF